MIVLARVDKADRLPRAESELDVAVLDRAKEVARNCDLMLVAGGSLAVQPAAGLVGLAARSGAAVVICNATETPYDVLLP